MYFSIYSYVNIYWEGGTKMQYFSNSVPWNDNRYSEQMRFLPPWLHMKCQSFEYGTCVLVLINLLPVFGWCSTSGFLIYEVALTQQVWAEHAEAWPWYIFYQCLLGIKFSTMCLSLLLANTSSSGACAPGIFFFLIENVSVFFFSNSVVEMSCFLSTAF